MHDDDYLWCMLDASREGRKYFMMDAGTQDVGYWSREDGLVYNRLCRDWMEGFTWCEGLEHWNPTQTNWWTPPDMHHSGDLASCPSCPFCLTGNTSWCRGRFRGSLVIRLWTLTWRSSVCSSGCLWIDNVFAVTTWISLEKVGYFIKTEKAWKSQIL